MSHAGASGGDLYRQGQVAGEKRAYETSESWIRPTIGPLIWVGVPLVASYYMMMGVTPKMAATSFAKWAQRRYARAAGKTKPEDEAERKIGSNPMADMMEAMMPIKKRNFRVDVKGTKFSDVIGIPEAKEDVKQYVDFLKTPKKFMRLGARLPKGCVLTGQPGTGKTLLAKAVAGEADVPFFSCNGADFIEIVGGSGPKRIRELFQEAREAAPCIVFIDEIDAIGSRGQKSGGMSSEENRTINQLLSELDGLDKGADPIVVLAATNFLDNIDKALLREGRFDRKVDVDMPDVAARREVFEYYLKKVVTGDPEGLLKTSAGDAVASDASVKNAELAKRLADLTPGVSPATISTIVNEAALEAGTTGAANVQFDHFATAIDNVLVGKKQRNRMGTEATERTALHEAGHALVAYMLPQQNRVLKVSITPRGNALGFTQKAGHEFHEYQTNVSMFTDMVVMMGGRAAEDVLLQNVSVGAMDDVQRATEMALSKLLSFGMSRKAGMLAFQPSEIREGREFAHFSEETQVIAEREAKKMVTEAYSMARRIVEENKDKIQSLLKALLEKKEIHAPEIEQLWGPRPKSPTTSELCGLLEALHCSAENEVPYLAEKVTSSRMGASTTPSAPKPAAA